MKLKRNLNENLDYVSTKYYLNDSKDVLKIQLGVTLYLV